MHITLSCQPALAALSQAASVIDRSQTLPVLSHCRLHGTATSAQIIATDLEMQIALDLSDVVAPNQFDVLLPLRKLQEIVAASSAEEVKLEVGEGGKTIVRSGASRFRLNSLPSQDMPSIEADDSDTVSCSIPQQVLRAALARIEPAMARNDVRYYLNGALLDIAEEISVVATDGHRLAREVLDVARFDDASRQAILPRKAVQVLLKLLAVSDTTVRVHVSESFARFELPGIRFTTKLIDGKYPDYRRLFDKFVPGREVQVSRSQFAAAIARCAILVEGKLPTPVRLGVNGQTIALDLSNSNGEETQDEIKIVSGLLDTAETLHAGFDPSYLAQAVDRLGDSEVALSLSKAGRDGDSTCLLLSPVGSNRSTHMIMSMRI